MCQRFLKLFFPASLTIMLIAKAGAVDYTAGFAIETETSHNDNIRLTQNDQISVTKYDVSPILTLGINTETTKAQVESTLDFNRYDRNEFDSDDQNLKVGLSRQFESSSVGLNAGLIRNSTLTSELLTTGLIGTKSERAEEYTVSPDWSYVLSEKNLIQISGTYTTRNYQSTSYIGYDNIGTGINWLHSINERLELIIAASYADYHSEDLDLQTPLGKQSYSTLTKTKNLQIGANYQITEQSLLSGRIGRSRNDTTYPIKDPNSICDHPLSSLVGAICDDIPRSINYGSTAQLEWAWKGEVQQFGLNATKTTQPTSNGYTVDSLQIGTNWSYKLSELNKIMASVTMVSNRAVDEDNSLQNTSLAERDYGSATFRFQRQLSQHWLLNASYNFSEQKYNQTDIQANSNVYSLGLIYRPQEWHWSR